MTGGGPDPLDETWDAWTSRVATDLAALDDDDWVTFTVHVQSQASSTYAAERAREGTRGRLEGLLALECIGDTEFEGLTDLTRDQQAALTALGWGREGDEPEFSRAFDSATDAAGLLRASLARVLGASTPADVDIRRAPRADGVGR